MIDRKMSTRTVFRAEHTIHLHKRTYIGPINRTYNQFLFFPQIRECPSKDVHQSTSGVSSIFLKVYFCFRQSGKKLFQFQFLFQLLPCKLKMKVLCRQVCVLALCQYDTALMIIALCRKIHGIWRGR